MSQKRRCSATHKFLVKQIHECTVNSDVWLLVAHVLKHHGSALLGCLNNNPKNINTNILVCMQIYRA